MVDTYGGPYYGDPAYGNNSANTSVTTVGIPMLSTLAMWGLALIIAAGGYFAWKRQANATAYAQIEAL